MTFSLKPRSSSTLPIVAASVRTRVVSWKDAAEMNESVSSAALVMPRSAGWASAGRWPSFIISSFTRRNDWRVTCSPQRNSVSPGLVMRTLRSIWRTMISMCLSLISTPWRR